MSHELEVATKTEIIAIYEKRIADLKAEKENVLVQLLKSKECERELRLVGFKLEGALAVKDAKIAELEGNPKEGYYGKYIISKADGSKVDPKADYFVLRIDIDPVARMAAQQYALHTSDESLGRSLMDRIATHFANNIDSDMNIKVKKETWWPLATIRQQDARIRELEAALISERTKRLYIIRSDGLDYTDLANADGGQWWEEEAKSELRAEGLMSEDRE